MARAIPLDDYSPIIGQPEVDELRALAGSLRGHPIQMVNSTAVGGGVAEILTRFVPILQELEPDDPMGCAYRGVMISLALPRHFTMRCTADLTFCPGRVLRPFYPIPGRIWRACRWIPNSR